MNELSEEKGESCTQYKAKMLCRQVTCVDSDTEITDVVGM